MDKRKTVLFLAVSDEDGSENRAYSNFVYALCKYAMYNDEDINSEYNIIDFKRHDMITCNNIRDSIYKCIAEYDAFVVLLDQYDISDNKGNYNSNVWFELGLASSQDKPIVLIAMEKNKPPFYVSDINIIKLSNKLIELFNKKQDNYKYNKLIENKSKIDGLFGSLADESEVSEFISEFIEIFKTNERPFIRNNDFGRINEIGFGSLRELFLSKGILDRLSGDYIDAKFITGEKEAFEELTNEVAKAKKSLRTSRFANQSIVAGDRANQESHAKFMNALYKASKRVEKCDRIICNNNEEKWHDIENALLYSNNKMNVYVRKNQYSIGFELVIIDKKVAFIHFYQLAHSGRSDNENIADPQKNIINSTLKICGYEVCSELANIFDRLHHRDFNTDCMDPSRTLLGMPSGDNVIGCEKRGCFKLEKNPSSAIESNNIEKRTRSREIHAIIYNSFLDWHTNMDFDDKKNMILGICLLNESYGKTIYNNLDKYFTANEMEDEKYIELQNKMEKYLK